MHGCLLWQVETPVLEATAGGADACPFVTFHNALQQPFVLRIATGAQRSLQWQSAQRPVHPVCWVQLQVCLHRGLCLHASRSICPFFCVHNPTAGCQGMTLHCTHARRDTRCKTL